MERRGVSSCAEPDPDKIKGLKAESGPETDPELEQETDTNPEPVCQIFLGNNVRLIIGSGIGSTILILTNKTGEVGINFVIWLQETSSQPRKGGLAGSSGVRRRRRRRREPVGSQVRQLEMDIKLSWGIKCWGKFAQVYRGSSRASPTGFRISAGNGYGYGSGSREGLVVGWLFILYRE